MSFGLEKRARQNLVCAILRPHAKAKADPRQFAVFGAKDTACTKAMEHVAEGFRYWLELDIKNCFPTIDPRYPEEACNSFTRLPLPAAVIRNSVMTEENANLQTDTDRRYDHTTGLYVNTAKLLIDARCGLPQGSPVSALVQELFVADVLRLVPDTPGARIISYADNFLIVARTKQDAEAMAQTLNDALGQLSAGRMSFDRKQKKPRHVRHGVEFLGYSLRHQNDTFTIKPKACKMDTFRTKAYALMRRFDRRRTRAKWLDLRRYVTGFRRAYAHWTTPGELHDAVLWTLLTRFRFEKLARTLADLVTDASPNGKRFPSLSACPRSKMLTMRRPSTRFRAYLA